MSSFVADATNSDLLSLRMGAIGVLIQHLFRCHANIQTSKLLAALTLHS